MFKFLKDKLAGWAKKISGEPQKAEKEGKKEEELYEKAHKKREKKEKKPEKYAEKSIGREQDETIEDIEKEGFFSRLKSKITKVKISTEDFERYKEDLRMLLLENNVAYEAAERIIRELEKRIVGKEFLKKEVEGMVKDSLKDIILEVLPEPYDIIMRIKEKTLGKDAPPYVILFVGINGTGKTTTIAKIADFLNKRGISSVIAAADTFRAASIEQLKKHEAALGIKVISQQYGADPASVGFDAISYAKKNRVNCVLIDTAGRMHTAKNLMKEVEKIAKVCKPDMKLFIGESITGNDSIEQAKSFNEAIGIDGIVLTKADVDEKGGTALSVGYVLKKPILFLGTGQGYDGLEAFSREKFVEKLGL